MSAKMQLLCCETAPDLSEKADQLAVKFSNQNKTFYNHISLALAVACYVTVFGLPVYSEYVSWYVFGEKSQIVEGKHVETCGPNMMGVKVNVGSRTNPILANYNTTSFSKGLEPYAWCGFLPGSYFVVWPSVVQTAIFTIFRNTGSTVKLAWQCVVGTATAILNIYFMTILYPEGGADPNYSSWVAWADLTVVLFLYLATKADVNTMMMGMNWTITLMLQFMNPDTGSMLGSYKTVIPYVNWDAKPTIVLVTSTLGCILAVCATVFPKPLLNIRRVHDDAVEITKGIDMCFKEAIEYFCGSAPTPKRFQVFAKMSALTKCVSRVQQNLEDSYWETCNCFQYGRIRELYRLFNVAIHSGDDEVYLVKAALKQLQFGDMHKRFADHLREPMNALREETIACLTLCARCCQDGYISELERSKIQQKIQLMHEKQQDLCNQYQLAMKKADYVSEELAADNLFVFSLSQWSKEIAHFATDLSDFEGVPGRGKNPVLGLITTAWTEVRSVFNPWAMFSTEQLRFTLMNGIPIMIGFAIATSPDASVFVQYSPVMPGTLSLLVSYDYGATFFKNVQRLMGVTFGQTLPLLVIAALHMLDCSSHIRFVIHAASVFLFFFAFTFMYYASERWSTIAVNVAGFGCYPILSECERGIAPDYSGRYKAIAQVIFAILLKMAIASLMTPEDPRDIACSRLRTLRRELELAFTAFFAGDIEGPQGLKVKRAAVKDALADCEQIAPKCDPSLEMVPGIRTPFKYELYQSTLSQLRLVLSDLDMLLQAMSVQEQKHFTTAVTVDAAPEDRGGKYSQMKEEEDGKKQDRFIFTSMSEQKAWRVIKEDCLHTIKTTMEMTQAVLEHDTEEPLKGNACEELKRTSQIMELDGLHDIYSQMSDALGHRKEMDDDQILKDTRIIVQLQRTRVTVAVNALALTVRHLGEMSASAFECMIYA